MSQTKSAVPVISASDPPTPNVLFVAREQQAFARKLAADDAKRARAGTTTMIAIAAFTIHDDPELIDGREINPGDEFEVSDVDVVRFTGRARLK